MKFNFKKIFTFIGNLILVLLIVIGIFVGVAVLPIKNNYKLLAVTSGSMEPKIAVGSLAIIIPAKEYKVGDIITFTRTGAKSEKETTTHRIQSVSEKNGQKIFVTKGDANNAIDYQTVTSDQIVGKYRFGIALLGYLLKYIKTLPGLVLIIVIPASIIVYEEIRKIGNEMRTFRAKRSKQKKQKSPKSKEKL